MRPTIILTTLAIVFGTTAIAQGTVLPQSQKTGPLRVQIQMTISGGPAASSAEDQQAAQEAMRRTIYQMSSKECAALQEAFKTDCRLTSLNVQNNARGGRQSETFVSATASYELSKASE